VGGACFSWDSGVDRLESVMSCGIGVGVALAWGSREI
jgi:hypothetical protein